MRRRPLASDVFLEWNAVAFPDGTRTDAQAERAWRWLYRRCFSKGMWKVPPDESRLVAEMGMSMALLKGRPYEAVEIGRRFLEHPEIDTLPQNDRNEALFWLGIAYLCDSDHDQGAETFRQILADEGWGVATRRLLVIEAIIAFCDHQEATHVIPLPIRRLVQDLLYDWPGFRKRSVELAELSTLAELRIVLEEIRAR